MRKQLAPLKLSISEREEIAIRQIIMFRNAGYDINTARISLMLPPLDLATQELVPLKQQWADILNEMAVLWETRLKHEAEAARKKQALYRQIGVGFRRTSEDTGSEVSEPSAQVPLCSLWIGHGGDSGTYQDGKPGRDGA